MLTTTTTIQKWGGITPENQSSIYRAVGTLEYISALRNLDAFLRSASREEITAADKIVSSHPQFAVYTGLANQSHGSSGTLVSWRSGQSPSKKQGLMWVVALARLEIGSIVGTFTVLPSPFEIVGPSQWEMPAYKDLLMDGAQTHFKALANDTNLASVALKIPGTEMLAYIRRLNLARAMLSAAARSNAQELSPQDWTQLVAQDAQLLAVRDRFSLRVNRYLAALNSYSKETKTITGEEYTQVNACTRQLIGERRELAAGTAKAQTFSVK